MPLSKLISHVSTSVSLLALTAEGFASIPPSLGVTESKPKNLSALSYSGSSVNDPWPSRSLHVSSADYGESYSGSSANDSWVTSTRGRSISSADYGESYSGSSANDPWATSGRSLSSADYGESYSGSYGNDSWATSGRSPSSANYADSQSPLSSPPAGNTATMPFMITQQMKRVLIEELRYTRKEVSRMCADRATSIIANRLSRPSSPNRCNDEETNVRPTATPQNFDASSGGFQLEEMEDQFGRITDSVLTNDQYGPSFSSRDGNHFMM